MEEDQFLASKISLNHPRDTHPIFQYLDVGDAIIFFKILHPLIYKDFKKELLCIFPCFHGRKKLFCPLVKITNDIEELQKYVFRGKK